MEAPKIEDFAHCEKVWINTPEGEMYFIPKYLKAVKDYERLLNIVSNRIPLNNLNK